MIAKAVVGFFVFTCGKSAIHGCDGFITEQMQGTTNQQKRRSEYEPDITFNRYSKVQTEKQGSCEVDGADLSQRGIDRGAV